MSSLSHIRSQISSVGNIKQIATSMEMVASARMRKAQDRAKQAKVYISKMQLILDKLSVASADFSHPLFHQRLIKKTGIVVVAADKGLCGAYNTNVFSYSDRVLKNYTPENTELTLLGKKAIQYFGSKPFKIKRSLPDWGGKISFEEIKALSDQLIHDFVSGEIDAIWLIYTKFHHLMDREVVMEKFLPLGKTKEEHDGPSLSYIFEPNLEEIYEQLLPRFCTTKIESILNESYASELAARIFSMKNAAKNADEMMQDLTLEYNKARQSTITRELLETMRD